MTDTTTSFLSRRRSKSKEDEVEGNGHSAEATAADPFITVEAAVEEAMAMHHSPPATVEEEPPAKASYADSYADASKEFFAAAIDAVREKQKQVREVLKQFDLACDKRMDHLRRQGEEFAEEARRVLGRATDLVKQMDHEL